jgi:hypothetical protein
MPFDPKRYLIKLQKRDYLEVKFRILWAQVDAQERGQRLSIQTDLIEHDPEAKRAMMKATISVMDPTIGISVYTGYGSEDAKDFGDYIEKAETKAIGRALALAGYGTQFSVDHDFGAGPDGSPTGKVVDAPVDTSKFGF